VDKDELGTAEISCSTLENKYRGLEGLIHLPIRMKIAAASATMPIIAEGMSAPRAINATSIKYTARRIKPMLLINLIK
jgi:hypothetical protein